MVPEADAEQRRQQDLLLIQLLFEIGLCDVNSLQPVTVMTSTVGQRFG